MPRNSEYENWTARQLEEKAKELGVPHSSSMKKEELVRALERHQSSGSGTMKPAGSGQQPQRSGRTSDGNFPGVLGALKEEHDEVKGLFESFERQASRDLEGSAQTV